MESEDWLPCSWGGAENKLTNEKESNWTVLESFLKQELFCYKQMKTLSIQILMSWLDSSVSIATGYGLDDQEGREFESR
jgi:hypothetical protein